MALKIFLKGLKISFEERPLDLSNAEIVAEMRCNNDFEFSAPKMSIGQYWYKKSELLDDNGNVRESNVRGMVGMGGGST